ncbi:hypothetical protein H0Z60_21330 [Ectothiorhodospiraceae bacterium WFHF3C12]|nr:hypothetical protein [Ectothiorhodospiraceae bacterium WFHF3C12]
MHPVVSLGLVVAVIVCLAAGGWPDILVAATACALALPRVPDLRLPGLARSLWRLRFFYLSLLILYAWFSPGKALFPALGFFSPSLSGIATAARYIAFLAVITTLVQLLMARFPREELVAALRWWLTPCRAIGLDPDRVALRLMLVAEVLPRLRELAGEATESTVSGRRADGIVPRAAAIYERTLKEAETVTPPRLELVRLPTPGAMDWAPAAVAVGVLAII